jgi:hypothetical protein
MIRPDEEFVTGCEKNKRCRLLHDCSGDVCQCMPMKNIIVPDEDVKRRGPRGNRARGLNIKTAT